MAEITTTERTGIRLKPMTADLRDALIASLTGNETFIEMDEDERPSTELLALRCTSL